MGVSPSGAFDRTASELANRLVGNSAAVATLEALGAGLTLRATRHLTVAVTGAHGRVLINDRVHSTHHVLHVAPGDLLILGRPYAGLRYYVAVRGGFSLPLTLGSAATDTLGHLGPQVHVGEVLPVGTTHGLPVIDHAPVRVPEQVFDVLAGPDLDLAPLLEHTWELDSRSNRIGVRLAGPSIPAPAAGLPSKPMVLGAVQLPPNGQPIILGPDHPTTGGYPVIAVVTRRSMSDVAQWAGGPRRFRLARS
jgi:biotin-dependent carboxylase-like uncharacterized protein